MSAARALLALAFVLPSAQAQQDAATMATAPAPAAPVPPLDSLPTLPGDLASGLTDGRAIFQQFRAGLAEPDCDAAAGRRWRGQFAHAPDRLADEDENVLPLFGYVVGELRQAGLPTEFALIPFVESGYRPGVRNGTGPAGLWQFIGGTARLHGVEMRAGYDGRLSPVESTQAAVSYLKKLYADLGGNWQLTVMAYNAGEGRLVQSLRRAGMSTADARPRDLPGLSPVTYTYVQKLHALACALEDAGHRPDWQQAMQRQVPRLLPRPLPHSWTGLAAWAEHENQDLELLASLNPALVPLRRGAAAPRYVLAPVAPGGDADALGVGAVADPADDS
ncbi:MAG: lytic transglycosylase domain-containing protein, partial [Pseudoxanthomonas sp.]